MLGRITPLILTKNEEANLGRCLDLLRWAGEVVILDSGSDDRTAEIAGFYSNARLESHPFDSHSEQWNCGLALVKSEWVLALDADYLVTPELRDAIAKLNPDSGSWGYEVRFRYAVNGKILRSSIYPPSVVLYRRQGAVYVQQGHTQRLIPAGIVSRLDGHIIHDDRKPLSRWIANQTRYAELEAGAIADGDRSSLGRRLRNLVVVAPVLVPLYLLAVKGLWLDGGAGLRYVMERTAAECLISLHVLDRRLRESARKDR